MAIKLVLSPAKSLDFESAVPTQTFTKPVFLKQAREVRATLKQLSPQQLMSLMDISDNLAQLNWNRNQAKGFGRQQPGPAARQAVYAFNGEVYTGLDAYTLDPLKIDRLQDTVRILSGLYGVLRPLDLINPYRLEMGTDLPVGDARNLYGFWKEHVTKQLNKELRKGDLFVNLASQEYFSAVDAKALKVPVVTADFKDYKNGKLTMISFFAKKARGMMARYIVEEGAETLDDLRGFNAEGYAFDSNLSTAGKLVFTR